MQPENDQPQPDIPVSEGGAGLSDDEAAARISAKMNPPRARRPDGKFQQAIPQTPGSPEPAPPPRQGPPPDDGAEPIDPEVGEAPDEAARTDEDIEIDAGDEAEATQPSSLDMPESWGKSTEAIWSALPPEAQQFLKQHEAKRTQGISRQMNELKAEQEKVSQATVAMEHERLQLAQAAQRYQSDTLKQFQAKFGDVKDVQQLARENPARFVEMQAAWSVVQGAEFEARQLQEAQQQNTLKQLQDFRLEENRKLVEAVGLKDEASAVEFEKNVMAYTGKHGIPAERVSQYRADELLMADKARKWDAAMAKKTAALQAARQPPPVLRPGSPQSRSSLSSQGRVEQLSRIAKKSGSEDDAAKRIRAKWGLRN